MPPRTISGSWNLKSCDTLRMDKTFERTAYFLMTPLFHLDPDVARAVFSILRRFLFGRQIPCAERVPVIDLSFTSKN